MYIEKDVTASIDNKAIMQRFQNIKICEKENKKLHVFEPFFCDVNMYSSFIFINFFLI